MKKLKSAFTITLLALSLIGCGASTNENVPENENMSDTAVQTDNTTFDSTTTNADASSLDSLDALKKAVSDAIAKTDSATPSNTAEENQSQFFNLKQELDKLDNQIDLYEDYLESQYRENKLSFEDYRSQENELEQLEEELDNAEDQLERIFGIDN